MDGLTRQFPFDRNRFLVRKSSSSSEWTNERRQILMSDSSPILMDGELFMIDDSEVPDRTWLSRAGGSMCV